MVVLGLGFTDHEASAALVAGGKPVAAVALERITRFKKDGLRFGRQSADLRPAIDYCLAAAGMTLSDVDLMVWNHVDHASEETIRSLTGPDVFPWAGGIPTLALPHHFAHACCAFYLSPFPDSAVLVADGNGGTWNGLLRNCGGPEPDQAAGEKVFVQNFLDDGVYAEGLSPESALELESFYHFDGHNWSVLRKILGTYGGVGGRYGAVSSLLFESPLDAGKTMGLAPYGDPDGDPDGDPAGAMKFLEPVGAAHGRAFRAVRGAGWNRAKAQLRLWKDGSRLRGAALDYSHPLPASFAAGIQREAEEALLEYARWLQQDTGARRLCLAGGAALNCVANSLIARESGFAEVFVPPAPGDDGIALGCALYGAAVSGGLAEGRCPIYLGCGYPAESTVPAYPGLERVVASDDPEEWLAARISEGACIGWFHGGSEFGPRALGHRSLLADPRSPTVRDHLNRVVKNRELFRPFAPTVLEEYAAEYFCEIYPSRFMSFIATVREEKRALLPAITHVDGTSRYQLLRKSDNPELYGLISEFQRITGIPMLLNTSFNRAGEPIVETPEQAARCVVEGAVDYLAVNGIVYRRQHS